MLADVVRRPAIAEDEPSLRADDLLRRMDAGPALFPYPACLTGNDNYALISNGAQ